MINLAEKIAQNPLKMPVLFVAFNAEEGSLKGSKYYTENPVVPLEKTLFMLNQYRYPDSGFLKYECRKWR